MRVLDAAELSEPLKNQEDGKFTFILPQVF